MKPFYLVFSSEIQNPLPCRRSSKYNAGQESHNGTLEYSDVRSGEVIKILVRERRTEERRDGNEARDFAYESILKGLVSNLKDTDKRLLLRVKSVGVWLSVRGTAVSGPVLSATEFWDLLCARYDVFSHKLLESL